MKAKKVNEMIDPYASEEDAIDLDLSYKKKHIIKWFDEYYPNLNYTLNKDFSVIIHGNFTIKHYSNPYYIGEIKKPTVIPVDKMIVEGFFDSSEARLDKLPSYLHAEDVYFNPNQRLALPKTLIVETSLYLHDLNITALPEKLKVNGQLFLTRLDLVEKLPKELEVKNTLKINKLPRIKEFSYKNFTLLGSLEILDCKKLTKIAGNLTIGDYFYLKRCPVEKITGDLVSLGNKIVIVDTKLKKIPENITKKHTNIILKKHNDLF